MPGRAAALAEAAVSVRHVILKNATHLLPLTEGDWCAALIVEHLDQTPLRGLESDRAGVR